MHERSSCATLTWLMTAVGGALLLAVSHPADAAGDPSAGRSVFQQQCSICHTVQAGRNMTGPTLFGIVGRKTGAVPGYTYSDGNKNANMTWDDATLDKYLVSPRTVIPGTKMTYAGVKDDKKRADLIAYLATLK